MVSVRLLVIGLLLALGCGDDVDVGREPRDGSLGDTDAAVDAGCMATLEVTLVFHEHHCVTSYVRCRDPDGIEESIRAGCLGYQDCREVPDPYLYTFQWDPDLGPCEFCSNLGGRDDHCSPIESGCGVKTLEDIPIKWGICDDDAGVDDGGS